MIRFLADENFNRHVVKGLWGQNPALEIAIAQEVGLSGRTDDEVLEWAARDQRVVLTHDIRTMTATALQRLDRRAAMTGLILIGKKLPVGPVIENLILIDAASTQDEWIGVILYLPL